MASQDRDGGQSFAGRGRGGSGGGFTGGGEAGTLHLDLPAVLLLLKQKVTSHISPTTTRLWVEVAGTSSVECFILTHLPDVSHALLVHTPL